MKILKIILIIVLLVVMCSISFGTGSITSGDKTIYLYPVEEYKTLDEWFYNLKLSEKIEIYNNYQGGK